VAKQDSRFWALRWAPTIAVVEREGKYVVRAELPGVKADEANVHVTERRYGSFYSAIPLPEGAKTDAVTARFDNGVLEIEIPVEQRKSARRQIQIQPSKAA
jgi:HSP20 family protein